MPHAPLSAPLSVDKTRSLFFLSILCFSLADVRDGLGPFLGVYLQSKGWEPDAIGYAMTIGGLAGMLCTTPMGALADRTLRKRLLIGVASTGIIVACSLLFIWTSVPVVWLSSILQGALAAVIAPGLSALTLGLVGQAGLPHQLGRNEAWNHAGNGATAVVSGFVGYFWGIPGVLAVMTVMGLLAVCSVGGIVGAHIDHAVARGLEHDAPAKVLPLRELASDLALMTIAVTLFFFHLGNAAMLPLLGQSAVAQFQMNAAAYTAGTIIIAQATMIGMSLWGARMAQQRGYGLLFLAALLALPVRGLIAGFYVSPWSIIPVQILDGVGAGLMGVATPGIVARLLQGTGRVNMGLGIVLTVQGVGAALSSSFGGLMASLSGYHWAFLALAVCPCLGLVFFVMVMGRCTALKIAAGPPQ